MSVQCERHPKQETKMRYSFCDKILRFEIVHAVNELTFNFRLFANKSRIISACIAYVPSCATKRFIKLDKFHFIYHLPELYRVIESTKQTQTATTTRSIIKISLRLESNYTKRPCINENCTFGPKTV